MMVQDTAPLPSLLRQIRTILRDAGRSIMSQAQPLISQAYSMLKLEEPGQPQTAMHSASLAYSISSMLKATEDHSFIRTGLGYLLKLGNMGEILAASYLHESKAPKQTLTAVLSSFEPHEQLFLANRFLQNPHEGHPWFMNWSVETVHQLQGDDPEEVLIFLESLSGRQTRVAMPVQRILLKGRFGVWLNQLAKLDLDQEQVGYMFATTGELRSHAVTVNLMRHLKSAEPDKLPRYLEILGRSGKKQHDKMLKTVSSFLDFPKDDVKLSALNAMLDLGADKLVRGLLFAFRKSPSLRTDLCLLLLRIPGHAFYEFMKQVGQEERKDILFFLVGLVSSMNPRKTVDTLLAPLVENNGIEKSLARSLEEFILAHKELPPPPHYTPGPVRKAEVEDGTEKESGGIMSHMRKVFSGSGGSAPLADFEVKSSPFPELRSGERLEKKRYAGLDGAGTTIRSSVFTECDFSNTDLTAATISKSRFENCAFKYVEFEGLRLHATEFENCRFLNCNFSGSHCTNNSFTLCELNSVHFQGAFIQNLETERCLFQENDFSGANIETWRAESCRFQAGLFAYTLLSSTLFDGVEFMECLFHKAFLKKSFIHNTTTPASRFHDCRGADLDCDEAAFIRNEAGAINRALDHAANLLKQPEPPPELLTPKGILLLFQLLERWFFEKDTKKRKQCFLEANQYRQQWAGCMMISPASHFLKMLPDLVEAEILLDKTSGTKAPACNILGYKASYTPLALLDQYRSEDITPADPHKAEDAIPIEALYSIGSTGTVAQSKDSDIDLWVCYDDAYVSGDNLELLARKCDWLEAWAESTFGLEVHFFLMELDSIRDNDFGFSDKESAGSTQAQLLKEEFYRTSIVLAGKKPAWWYFPPQLSADAYEAHLGKLRQSITLSKENVLDLGNLEEVPKEEFFGASLWQIVKGMKSPFKSVMKLALLDKYIAGKQFQTLICNRVKQNLFQGKWDLWDVDPYAVLFREVFEYYYEIKKTDAQQLMRLSFLQKAGQHFSPARRGKAGPVRENSFLEYFFPHSEADIAAHIDPDRATAEHLSGETRTFNHIIELGNQVVRFMLETYATIQHHLKSIDLDYVITSEDLTKLGRKLFSTLNPRPGKIMRIPFVQPPHNLFTALEFSCEGLPGRPMEWIVRGELNRRAAMRSGLEEISRDTSPERLLLWLVANDIYRADTLLRSTALAFPLSLPDITGLLKALLEFFPPSQTLDTDIHESLKEESVTRAYIISNFTIARDEKTHRSATLVYATNWGELFCLPNPKEIELLKTSGRKFLQKNSNTPLASNLLLDTYAPHKSLAPKINIF